MKLRRVKPDSIQIPEVRVTARFDEEMWEQFRSSIKELGAIAPIICIENEKGLFLVDGLHRLVEAKNNGEKVVDVAVIPGDEVDVYTKNLFLDHLRGKPPVTDQIKVIELLIKELGLDSEKIAAKTGLTRDYVEKLQRLSELTPRCLAALNEGVLGVGQAHELLRLPDPVDQEVGLGYVRMYGWKFFELSQWIDAVLEQRGIEVTIAASSEEVKVYKLECAYCHNKYEIKYISNPHTCQDCAGILLAAMAQARMETKAAEVSLKE